MINDKVFVKLKGNVIVSATEKDFDVQLSFEIIGYDGKRYLLKMPSYYSIKNSWLIKDEHLSKFGCGSSYLDKRTVAIHADKIFRIQAASSPVDGLYCEHCKEFYPMAEPNQSDGTLRCYACRENPFR
jgi:hypothetical protein